MTFGGLYREVWLDVAEQSCIADIFVKPEIPETKGLLRKNADEKQAAELNDFKGREIGYVLAKDYWGRGLMPEAVKAVIDWMFEHTDIDFLTCGYFVHNRQSKRVQEKCGFHFLKYIEFETILGTTEKTSLNILYRSDWQKTKETE